MTDSTGAPTAPTWDRPHEFTADDRCDRCGAQAFVEVRLGEGVLMFCGHHYTAHEAAIQRAGGAGVDDRRQTLVGNRNGR